MSLRTIYSLAFLTTFVVFRVMPHPWNFTPTLALFAFSALVLKGNLSWILPLVGMLISDAYLGFYDFPTMATVYLTFALMNQVIYHSENKNLMRTWVSGLLGSFLFFVTTNFMVWLHSHQEIYARSWQGILDCYTAALPFYRNQFFGDLFWLTLFALSYILSTVFCRAYKRNLSPI